MRRALLFQWLSRLLEVMKPIIAKVSGGDFDTLVEAACHINQAKDFVHIYFLLKPGAPTMQKTARQTITKLCTNLFSMQPGRVCIKFTSSGTSPEEKKKKKKKKRTA